MPLFHVFLLFVNGHAVKVAECVYEENARQMTDYHHGQVSAAGCWCEVNRAGRQIYTTRKD